MSKIAVIKTGGKQYKVAEHGKLKIEKIEGEVGDKVKFEEILLTSDSEGNDLKIGTPILKDAKVEAIILKQERAKKLIVVKYKAKTRYRRKLGHRQYFTEIQIASIA